MFQTWHLLTFLHWPYEPSEIQALLPHGLRSDVFGGRAWVGLTPFLLRLRPPFLPRPPWIGQFPETNVRTYVRDANGERGIWFFTLEAARILAVAGARVLYGLPYHWSAMRVEPGANVIEYRSRRHGAVSAATRISIRIGDSLRARDLDNFLTARYRLYTRIARRLAFADIEHEPWPLRTAVAAELEQSLIESTGVPTPRGEPLVHYSPGVTVRIGRLHLLK